MGQICSTWTELNWFDLIAKGKEKRCTDHYINHRIAVQHSYGFGLVRLSSIHHGEAQVRCLGEGRGGFVCRGLWISEEVLRLTSYREQDEFTA